MEEKFYQLGTYTECQWDELHKELTEIGSNVETIPQRAICCSDDQLHSKTRGTYLLTEEEAENLKKDPRIKFLNIDYKQYSKIYKPPPEELQATTADLLNRWTGPVKNIRRITGLTTGDADINRTGYQLLRLQQFLDPWVGTYADNFNVSSNISYYGTGKNIDAIVADDGTWFGHPEFCNNPVKISDGTTPIETPNDYVGGNVLPGNGYCDLLDLVLDSPYYIDPAWFDADPDNRLIERWDGTIVPVETVARAWWADSSQRSAQFASAGTVSITSGYTRAYCNGSNIAYSSVGNHGTPCAALVYGRTQGWAYNSNKWAYNLYNVNGTDIEPGFDVVKLFHLLKPVNSVYGNKDPTVMSNSWGYRANKAPSGTQYYTHRSASNVAYTTETGINWLSHMGTQGDGGRWKSEMKTNSITTALDELIESGVIFVAAAGNSNQKQVGSDHPDFNNYITSTNGGSLEASSFLEFNIEVTGTTNRRGFPQQAGMYDEGGVRFYPAINIGALDDNFRDSKEAKVGYSDRGEEIDVYAPADGTLAANRASSSVGNRVDTYPQYRIPAGDLGPTDTGFSAACSTTSVLSGGAFTPSPNSSLSIVTSTGAAAITSISSNFLSITSNPVTAPTSGNNDDGFYTVTIPWTISYNGVGYNTVYVGTNTYLTFVSGSAVYSNISGSNPNLNKICVSASDNSIQRIYTDTIGTTPNRTFIIRIQGTASTGGTLGNPNMEWEYHFFENDIDRIDLHVLRNARFVAPGVTAPVNTTDTSFSGTSAACPVAAGFISTVMEYNRTWGWQDVKTWLRSLTVQSSDRFYYGIESTDPLTSNWLDYNSIEGGDARVLYQDPDVYNVIPILSPNIRSRASGKLSFKNGIRLRKR